MPGRIGRAAGPVLRGYRSDIGSCWWTTVPPTAVVSWPGSLGATVVIEQRRGYGAAVHAGLASATADVVVVMDCDGSLDPAELPVLVDAVLAGRCDLATGRRRPVQTRSWPWHARAGNRVLAMVLSHSLHGLSLADLGPVRVARRLDLLALGVGDRRSGYPVETLIRAANAGWRIEEFDLQLRAAGARHQVQGLRIGARHPDRHRRHPAHRPPSAGGGMNPDHGVDHGQGAGGRSGEDPAVSAAAAGAGCRSGRGRSAGHPGRGRLDRLRPHRGGPAW